jgi:hypothetical protein
MPEGNICTLGAVQNCRSEVKEEYPHPWCGLNCFSQMNGEEGLFPVGLNLLAYLLLVL